MLLFPTGYWIQYFTGCRILDTGYMISKHHLERLAFTKMLVRIEGSDWDGFLQGEISKLTYKVMTQISIKSIPDAGIVN